MQLQHKSNGAGIEQDDQHRGDLGVALTGANLIGLAYPQARNEVFKVVDRFITEEDFVKYMRKKEAQQKACRKAARVKKREKKATPMTKEQFLEGCSAVWDQGEDPERESLKRFLESWLRIMIPGQEG